MTVTIDAFVGNYYLRVIVVVNQPDVTSTNN